MDKGVYKVGNGSRILFGHIEGVNGSYGYNQLKQLVEGIYFAEGHNNK